MFADAFLFICQTVDISLKLDIKCEVSANCCGVFVELLLGLLVDLLEPP